MKLAILLISLFIIIQISFSFKVIVVGAGVSGLSAANYLQNAGHNVTILEARNRTCGRIWTAREKFGSDVVGTEADLGAGWIHGSSSSHPITQLFQNASLADFVTTDDDSINLYDSTGNYVSSSTSDTSYSAYSAAMSNANQIGQSQTSPSQDVSVGSVIKNTTNWNSDIFRYHVAASIEFNSGSDIDNLSIQRYNDDSQFKGVENLVRKGYDQLCNVILKNSLNTLQLNTIVSKITDNGNNVTVTDSNGNTYNADRVLVTVPLGALQKNLINFSPALSAQKLAAINRLGYGNVNKLVLEFPTQFWSSSKTYIGKAMSNSSQRGLWTYFLNAQPITSKPTIIAIAIGQAAYDVEALSQTDAVNVALNNLKAIYGASNVGTPNRTVMSSWGKDQFAGYGTYSYAKVGTLTGDADLVAQAQGNIYFAGEATYMKYRGTVHGAYLSGQLQGSNIVNDYSKSQSSSSSSSSHSHSNSIKLQLFSILNLILIIFLIY